MALHSKGSRFSRGRLAQVVGAAVLALVVAGCQSHGNVTGKVLYKNKPVVFGTVLVQGSDGNARQGNIGTDGSFTVRGVAVGSVKVAVNSPNPRGITLVPPKDPNKKQEPYPDVPGWFEIPKKYDSVSTSGLSYQIKGGGNAIDIELQ